MSGIVSGSGKDTIIDFGSAVTKIDALFKEIGKNPKLQQMIGEDAISQLTNLRFVFDYMTKKSDAGTSLVAARLAAEARVQQARAAMKKIEIDLRRGDIAIGC